jgi:hypothetical protein
VLPVIRRTAVTSPALSYGDPKGRSGEYCRLSLSTLALISGVAVICG